MDLPLKMLAVSIFIVFLVAGVSYANAEIVEIHVDVGREECDCVDIWGKTDTKMESLYLRVFDSSGNLMPAKKDYARHGWDYAVSRKDGNFLFSYGPQDLNGYGIYVGDLDDNGKIQNIQFELKPKIDPTTGDTVSFNSIDPKDQQIENLQNEIERLQSEIREKNDIIARLNDSISELQKKLMI